MTVQQPTRPRAMIGDGAHTYEWIGDWARIPEGIQLGFTHGVVADSQDRIYIFHQGDPAMLVFDREGNYLSSWGSAYSRGAHGLFLSREDGSEYLYLSDYELSAVFKTSLDGHIVWSVTAPPLPDVYPAPEAFFPTDVCTAPDGRVFVFDGYGQGWVHLYTRDGEYVRSFDGSEGAAGKFQCPHGGWVDTRGSEPVLLVADRGNNRIQVLDLDGGYRDVITEGIRFPCCFYQDGDEMIIPDLHARITIFDKRNKPVAQLGDTPGIWDHPKWPDIPHEERREGHFLTPHACCVDSHGDLYVVEFIPDGRITKLRRV